MTHEKLRIQLLFYDQLVYLVIAPSIFIESIDDATNEIREGGASLRIS
jgi:hypothetical protein